MPGPEAKTLGSFYVSPGRGRPRKAPAPGKSPPPHTRGGRGARVLRRLQYLQNTEHFSRVQAEPGNPSALLEPRNPAGAEEIVTLNPRRRGPAVNIF